MEKKKIIVVTHSAANGGAERVSCLIANQFVQHGHDVTFYAIHSDSRQYFLDDRIHYVYCDVKSKTKINRNMERAFKLNKFVRENNFDAMYSFIYLEGIFLVGYDKMKKIYSLRNDPAHAYNTGINRIIRDRIYRDADNIVFQTPDARDFFEQKIRDKGVVVPNPVRDNLPYWKAADHSNDIVAACRISEQKNLKMMIDAFKIFNEKVPGYRLVIYGKGPQQEMFEKYVKELNLTEKILFPGFCDNIQDKMADAAMYVSSSDYEGISNSMMEALAIGTPTICTDCPIGGASMSIKSGVNGFLVPVGGTEEMAEKMIELAGNVELQNRFSAESVKCREELTEEKIFKMWESVL